VENTDFEIEIDYFGNKLPFGHIGSDSVVMVPEGIEHIGPFTCKVKCTDGELIYHEMPTERMVEKTNLYENISHHSP